MRFSSRSDYDYRVGGWRQVATVWVAPIIAVILGAMAAIMLLVSQSQMADARLLAAEGVQAEAEVLDRRIVEERKTDRDGDSRTTRTYYVKVSFVTADGQTIQIEESVGRARYDAVSLGSKVQLYYAPSQPTLIEFEKGDKASSAAIFRWVGLGLGAAAVIAAGVGVALFLRRPKSDQP